MTAIALGFSSPPSSGCHVVCAHDRAGGAGVLDRRLRQHRVTSGLNDLGWALSVTVLFSAAMLVMAGSFGLWPAGIISKAAFAAGVAAVVLVLLGGTTWAHDGFWAPDGGYAIVSGIILYVWVAMVSGFLVMRRPSSARAPERAAVPTA